MNGPELKLVIHTITSNSAMLWAGAAGSSSPPASLSLSLSPAGSSVTLSGDSWRRVDCDGILRADEVSLFIQRVPIPNLQPNREYELQTPLRRALRFRTLPEDLPGTPDDPLTILVCSCFYSFNDEEGRIGLLAQALPREHRPHFKVMCGDQVYLDSSSFFGLPDFFPTFTSRGLARRLLRKYFYCWNQQTQEGGGFQSLLETGGTFFLADDHEFWNNYPNPAPLVTGTWLSGRRERWERIARSLFEDFQTDDPGPASRSRQFQIGKLSCFIADTRLSRDRGDTLFMHRDDMDRLKAWTKGLGTPGLLFIGQPVFTEAAGVLGRKLDRSLANYRQYGTLVQALQGTRQSLLIVTGDSHFGRIATVELLSGPRERRIWEVISSPASLVSRLAVDQDKNPPSTFPADAIPDTVKLEIESGGLAPGRPEERFFLAHSNHFLTLQLWQRAERIRVRANYWFRDPGEGELQVRNFGLTSREFEL